MAGTSALRFSVQGGIIATIVVAFLLVLVALPVSSSPLRLRRQSAPRYNINLLAVVDNKMYTWFQQWLANSANRTGTNLDAKIKEYTSLVVRQMNVRLNNNDLPLLNLVKMNVNESVLTSNVSSSGRIDADKALNTFRDWLQARQLSSKYDHAILFTGYDFGTQIQGGETKGRAYVNRMCDTTGFSASVVQESGGFQSAHYAVHEVGHSLGAVHDGEGESTRCSAADRYVMAPSRDGNDTTQTILNPWYFSICSSAVIWSSLSTSNSATCFRPNVQPMAEFAATANLAAGQLYPADIQCQMMYGQESLLCLGMPFTNLDQICTSMFCMIPGNQSCAKHFAAEGTTCGNMKWCRSGRCEVSNSAPRISETCLNRDSVFTVNGQSCPDFIRANPWACYNQTFSKTVCCSSCETVKRNSPGCQYGDRVINCRKNYCGLYERDDCCETCGTAPACVDVASIDGVSCERRTVQNQQQACYNTTVAASCCQTCSRKRTQKAGCEYGDRVLGNGCDNVKNNTLDCASRMSECCATCGTIRHLLHWVSAPMFVVLSMGAAFNSCGRNFL